jgi:hypothetical protein
MAFASGIVAAPTVQRDDGDVRITLWDCTPNTTTGQHRHAWPCVVVMLTDAIIRVDGGSGVTETHLSAGLVRFGVREPAILAARTVGRRGRVPRRVMIKHQAGFEI